MTCVSKKKFFSRSHKFTAYKRRNFTLLELIVVLMVGALLLGLVVGRIGKLPAFASLDRTAHDIERLMSYASWLSLRHGREIKVNIGIETGQIEIISDLREPGKEDGYTNFVADKSLADKYMKLSVPEYVKLTAPALEPDEDVVFCCYPDGTASSPELFMTLGKHALKLWMSPLTGMIMRKEVPTDEAR